MHVYLAQHVPVGIQNGLPPMKRPKAPACIKEVQVHKLWTKVYSPKGVDSYVITVGQDITGFVNLCNLVQGELVVQANIKATYVLVLYFVSDIEHRHDDDDCRYMWTMTTSQPLEKGAALGSWLLSTALPELLPSRSVWLHFTRLISPLALSDLFKTFLH